MNIIGAKIRDLREEKGYNQAKLSEMLNQKYGLKTDRVMISKWETGFQTPMTETVKTLADFFQVSIDYLNGIGSRNPPGRQNPPGGKAGYPDAETVDFPVIGVIRAGYGSLAELAQEEYTGETLPVPLSILRHKPPEEFFVLEIKGSSMYPRLLAGDRVLIERQSTVDSGTVAAVMYNSEEATIKTVRYEVGEDWLELIPANPEYETKRIEGAELELCRVLGKVAYLFREF